MSLRTTPVEAMLATSIFMIRVPYYAMVDIETRIGNLNVTSIRSTLVPWRMFPPKATSS